MTVCCPVSACRWCRSSVESAERRMHGRGLTPARCGDGSASGRVPRHSPGVGNGTAEQHLDVRVEAAELIAGPAHQPVPDRRVARESSTCRRWLSFKASRAFTTGDGGCSPQSTEIRC
jgi:hypothetical protein